MNWKFAPLAKLQPLLDGGLDGSAYPFLARQTDGADVEWGRSDDPVVGTAGLPEDRAAAAAWTARDAVLKVTVKATESFESVTVTRSGFGTQARAAHTVITAEQHAQGIVVLDNRGPALLSENVEIVVRDGARLTVVSLQDWDDDAVHVSTQFAEVGRDAFLKHVVVSLGGDVVRVNPSTHLGAQGADTEMYGVYFADAGQYIEQQVYVNHDAPNTRGRVNYKGALQGEGAHTPCGSATCSSDVTVTAPTRTSRTATWCSPTAPVQTASRTSRSRRATSRAPATPVRPVASTTSSSSTCRPAASPRKRHVVSCARLPRRGHPEDRCARARGAPHRRRRAGARRGPHRGRRRRPRGRAGGRLMAEKVCAESDIAVDSPMRVVVDGTAVAIVKDSAGTVHAIGDTCTHGDISLAEGFVEGDTLECWAHGSRFSLATGKPQNFPAYEPVPVFRTEVRDGDVYVDVHDPVPVD